MPKTLVIVQARLNSKRFPKKVMQKLGDRMVIDYLIDFVETLPFSFVFAIPKNDLDESLREYLLLNNIPIFEGSENDLLDRFYQCAKKYKASIIIRLCADTPFLRTSDVLLQCAIYNEQGRFTYGNGVYVFSFQELKEAWKKASTKEQREHIIPYMMKCIDYPGDLKRWEKLCGGGFGQRISNRSRS